MSKVIYQKSVPESDQKIKELQALLESSFFRKLPSEGRDLLRKQLRFVEQCKCISQH